MNFIPPYRAWLFWVAAAIVGVLIYFAFSRAAFGAEALPVRIHCGGGATTDWIANVGGVSAVFEGDRLRAAGGVYEAANYNGQAGIALHCAIGAPVVYGPFDLPDGSYLVTLRFWEPSFTQFGMRLENVYANDYPILTGLDTFSGTRDRIVVRQIVANVAGGKGLTLRFSPAPGSTDYNAVVSSIEIEAGPPSSIAPAAMPGGIAISAPLATVARVNDTTLRVTVQGASCDLILPAQRSGGNARVAWGGEGISIRVDPGIAVRSGCDVATAATWAGLPLAMWGELNGRWGDTGLAYGLLDAIGIWTQNATAVCVSCPTGGVAK